MGFQTMRCALTASERVRQQVWEWTEKYTLLINELLDRVATHENFPEWQEQGKLSRGDVAALLMPLKETEYFKDLPGRFYTSAVLMVQYTYLAWLALQKKRYFKLTGKQRWLEVLEADLELASTTAFEWREIRGRAFEILDKTVRQAAEWKKPIKQQKPSEKTPAKPEAQAKTLNLLFERHSAESDPLSCRAIAYLIRNNLQVDAEDAEESLDELLFRFEKKRIEIERLGKQLESRKPKGRDPLGTRFEAHTADVTRLPKHTASDTVRAEFNIWKAQSQIQFLNTLHYPVLYETCDVFWSFYSTVDQAAKVDPKEAKHKKRRCRKRTQKSSERICLTFSGFQKWLGRSPEMFKVQCDRRQLPFLHQIAADWQAHKRLPDDEKFSTGLMLLKSVQLLWQKDELNLRKKKKTVQQSSNTHQSVQPVQPWQTHRLYLHFTIDPRLLTAEGTNSVRQEKLIKTGSAITGLEKAKAEQSDRNGKIEDLTTLKKKQKNQEGRIKAKQTSLGNLQRDVPQRPSQPPYQGYPHILVGVSLNQEQPVGVVVMDMSTQKVIEYQSTRQLLSNRTIKAKRGNRSLMQLRLEQYRLVNRRHRQQQKNAVHRAQEQRQNRYAQSKSQSNLGEYIDRLIASRIVKLALKWKASSIVIPTLGDIRESTEASIKARAERKYPNEHERQQRYAKQYRSSVHHWSYSRLAQCIESCASRVGIAVEQGHQSAQGTLQEQAEQVALYAYHTRQQKP